MRVAAHGKPRVVLRPTEGCHVVAHGGEKLVQRKDQDLQHRTRMISHLLDLWAAHAPVRLRGLILDWVQKEKGKSVSRTSVPLLHLKF